jgi:hypothetical protein
MMTAKQRFYLGLLLLHTLLGGILVSLFTSDGDIPRLLGWLLATCLLATGFFLLAIMLREKIQDWKIVTTGKRVLGRISSIESNVWLNLPVIIHYQYQVGGKKYKGSTWTTIHYLDRVPIVGTDCWVVYDEKHPQKSVVEDVLKPPF